MALTLCLKVYDTKGLMQHRQDGTFICKNCFVTSTSHSLESSGKSFRSERGNLKTWVSQYFQWRHWHESFQGTSEFGFLTHDTAEDLTHHHTDLQSCIEDICLAEQLHSFLLKSRCSDGQFIEAHTISHEHTDHRETPPWLKVEGFSNCCCPVHLSSDTDFIKERFV